MQNAGMNAQRIVGNVCASMRAEGFSVSEATRRECYDVASGRKSATELIREKISRYKKDE